jgi:hypothetical protein
MIPIYEDQDPEGASACPACAPGRVGSQGYLSEPTDAQQQVNAPHLPSDRLGGAAPYLRGQIRERVVRLVPGHGDAGLAYSSISIPSEVSAWRSAAGSA